MNIWYIIIAGVILLALYISIRVVLVAMIIYADILKRKGLKK